MIGRNGKTEPAGRSLIGIAACKKPRNHMFGFIFLSRESVKYECMVETLDVERLKRPV